MAPGKTLNWEATHPHFGHSGIWQLSRKTGLALLQGTPSWSVLSRTPKPFCGGPLKKDRPKCGTRLDVDRQTHALGSIAIAAGALGRIAGKGQDLNIKLLDPSSGTRRVRGVCFLPAEEYVLFSPVGFKGNLSLLKIYIFFSRGLNQMEVCYWEVGLFSGDTEGICPKWQVVIDATGGEYVVVRLFVRCLSVRVWESAANSFEIPSHSLT